MAPVGPVELDEVRLVLGTRLRALRVRAAAPALRCGVRRAGRGRARARVRRRLRPRPRRAALPAEDRRGSDPARCGAARARAPGRSRRSPSRVAAERLALRLAVGAARRRVHLSYPRIDVEQARPRVPSFYTLEALRAAEGSLPGFEEMATPRPGRRRRAARLAGAARSGRCHRRRRVRPGVAAGAARRRPAGDQGRRALSPRRQPASRARAARPGASLAAALDAGRRPRRAGRARDARRSPVTSSAARSFSPTALQNFAACPYRFFLQAIHRLKPREEPAAIEQHRPADARRALPRGAVRDADASARRRRICRSTATPSGARSTPSTAALDEVADRYRDELAPAIPRVWDDGSTPSAPTCASGCAARRRRRAAGCRIVSSCRSASPAASAARRIRRASAPGSRSPSAARCAARSTSSSATPAARCG